jgi:glutamate synthase domain-containing protein 2
MVDEDAFLKDVERFRRVGAKYVTLKTGAYRAPDLARAVKFASEAKIDLLTVDGAGGGTGMSPWRMMNEWGIPTVYLESLLYKFLKRLEARGQFVPSCAIAGGIVLEDQILKAIALGAPYIKAVCMGRSTLTAAMVAKTQGRRLQETFGAKGKKYQDALLRTFAGAEQLKEKFGEDFVQIPPAAIGVYTYYDRLATGMRQFMAGARKFGLKYVGRGDLISLTREAADVTGIPYVMEADMDEAERILG